MRVCRFARLIIRALLASLDIPNIGHDSRVERNPNSNFRTPRGAGGAWILVRTKPGISPEQTGIGGYEKYEGYENHIRSEQIEKIDAHLGFEQSFIERARDEGWSEVLRHGECGRLKVFYFREFPSTSFWSIGIGR